MGNLDLELLGKVINRSLPGIYIGSMLRKVPDLFLEMLLQLCSFRRMFGF
jgi:hypothetical protein